MAGIPDLQQEFSIGLHNLGELGPIGAAIGLGQQCAFLISWICTIQLKAFCSLASSGAHPILRLGLLGAIAGADRWNWIFAVCSSSFFVTCRRSSISGNTACTTNATNSKFRSMAKRLCNACWHYGRHACNVPNWSNCRLTHVEL